MDITKVAAAAERLQKQKQDYDYQYRCIGQGSDQALLASAYLELVEQLRRVRMSDGPYIEFSDQDDPKSSACPEGSPIRFRIEPKGMLLMLPGAKHLSAEDQEVFEQILRLAYEQGKRVGALR